MRLWFSIGFFVASILYTLYGLQTLSFLTSAGRPGPGYFPLIIGVGLIICTGVNCIKDFKARKQSKEVNATSENIDVKEIDSISLEEKDEDITTKYKKDTVWMIFLIFGFIAVLTTLGGLVTMMLFMFVLLWKFNRGKIVKNTIYSILFPIGLYLLFDVWLQAGLPKGIFGF
ncbi:tripartite tricarboxylate transporter TctB family protein [Anaerobacillus sp. MEB173]|uniref:tripartite tricarboxylate transporter TctB family protein n=1 Tax=Anaerobacillus sp. MEB173 TaxID=3383345 RepID=UPI003F8E8545